LDTRQEEETMMTLEQVEALLHPLEFPVGTQVKVFPQNTDFEPLPGIVGTVAEIYVVDDRGIHALGNLEEVDNENLGSVYYLGIEFDPDDPMLGEGADGVFSCGLYYVWELEAA
jgi:hypothetical protein